MKFYCDACNTKYAISDEKVRGKVLKVRCKNCGAIITVREAQTPATASRGTGGASPPSQPSRSSTPQAPSSVPTTNWYYALNGQTAGPFTLSALRTKYQRAELSDATYVWHEQIVDWKPVTTVDAFKDAVAQGHQIRPRRKTIGFSGELQAIQASEAPKGLQTGAVPREPKQQHNTSAQPQRSVPEQPRQPQRSEPEQPRQPQRPDPSAERASKPKEEVSTPSRPARPEPAEKAGANRAPSPSPEKRDKKQLRDPRRDKLERLRKRLTSDAPLSTSETDFSTSSEPKPEPTAKPDPQVSSAPASQQPEAAPSGDGALPTPVGGEAMFTFAEGVTPASAESSQELRPAPERDVIDFGLPPRASDPKPSPSSRSDILDQVIGPVGEQPAPSNGATPVDSGVIPFFSEGPEFAASDKIAPPSGPSSSQTSGSLLIQLGQIQKEGRGKRWVVGAVVGLLVLSLGGAAAFMALTNKPTEPVGNAQPSIGQQPDHKDELVIKKYSKDDVTKLATLELEDEMLFDESDADVPPEEAPAESKTAAAQKQEKKTKTENDGARKTGTETKKGVGAAKKSSTGAKATETAEKSKAPEEEEDDVYKALLSARAGKSKEIKAPEDKILDGAGNSTGLSKDQARRGFQRVKKSVRDCRERHNRHNARLDAGKIKLSVTVQPNGRVSNFDVKPESVKNTEFERCMQSHKGRWHFSPFGGKEVVINTSIIMQ